MTSNRSPSLLVDFNNDDDNDVIRALKKRASDPDALYVGQPLRLEDGEGNACLGIVTKLDDKSVWVKAIYSTWVPGQPVTFSLMDDLDYALHCQLNMSASSATSAMTPELV